MFPDSEPGQEGSGHPGWVVDPEGWRVSEPEALEWRDVSRRGVCETQGGGSAVTRDRRTGCERGSGGKRRDGQRGPGTERRATGTGSRIVTSPRKEEPSAGEGGSEPETVFKRRGK